MDRATGTPQSAASKHRWSLRAPFKADGGVGWRIVLPDELHPLTDRKGAVDQSPLILREDGHEIGPAHVAHEQIRRMGGGRYSFWNGSLYFSTSDGSDPNTNGRRYEALTAGAQDASLPEPVDVPEPPPKPEEWTLSPPFRQKGAFCWIGRLPAELHGFSDTNEEPYISRLRLREDSQSLGPPHSNHNVIEKIGSGRYSFWADSVRFSSSDGSDPNSNGKTYIVELWPEHPVELAEDDEQTSLVWERPDRPLRCAIYGLGNRGVRLASLAKSFEGVEITWLIDASNQRIDDCKELFGKTVRTTTDLLEPLADPELDIVVVAIPDHLHRSVAEAAFNAGKHVFLEKPIATTTEDMDAILAAWQRSRRVLQVGYVLRQAPFYAAIKKVVKKGILGTIRVVYFSEQLQVRHGASFMRRWHSNSKNSGGLIVHKGCHDLDLICWLLDTKPRYVTSFGGSDLFKRKAPAQFCSQCAERHECPYVDTGLHERRTRDEATHPARYGLDRCVFNADKDIVDHQIVSFELDNGTQGSFHLSMQGPVRNERRITLVGDRATLEGVFEDGEFTITFTDSERRPMRWSMPSTTQQDHGGGDSITMFAFLDACVGRSPPRSENYRETASGLVFAIAAENARRTGKIVKLHDSDFSMKPRLAEEPQSRRA